MLPKLIAKACESRIPRSGEEGKKVNCFVVAVDRDGSPFFVATGYEDQRLTGLKWDGHSYAIEHSLMLSELENGPGGHSKPASHGHLKTGHLDSSLVG